MKPHRLTIIDRIHGYANDLLAEEWRGERDWAGIKKVVKRLVKLVREDDGIVSAESNHILVTQENGYVDVYINVGTWSE